MNIDEILANKELFLLRKKSEIQKSDFSNFIDDHAQKAIGANETVEVLVYESTISRKRNEFMFDQYKNGYVLNHSTGMRYVKLAFCYNSEDPIYSEDKKNWDKYFPMVLNPKDIENRGWFVAVLEAKSVEGSAVVKGSNFLTPVISIEIIDEDTLKIKCAVSPSNIVDSHSDVHIPGLWKKTLNENNYDLLIQEHDMCLEKVIADSINDGLKVYTENYTIRELMARFKKTNKSEPLKDTQKAEPSSDTQKEKSKFLHLL